MPRTCGRGAISPICIGVKVDRRHPQLPLRRPLFLRFFALGFVFLILAMASPPGTLAQTSGAITGTVTDETGAVMPSAKVTITNSGTGVVV